MLLVLILAYKASELTNLNLRFSSKHPNVYVFSVCKITKTWTFYSLSSEEYIHICRITDICIVRGDLSMRDTQSLVNRIKQYKAVCLLTISTWLREVLNFAGIDSRIFKDHSTWSASTSKVKYQGFWYQTL